MSDDLTRLTVDLSESAATALDFAAVLTGDSRTDTVGRALLVYSRIVEAATSGGGRLSFELIDGGDPTHVEVRVKPSNPLGVGIVLAAALAVLYIGCGVLIFR